MRDKNFFGIIFMWLGILMGKVGRNVHRLLFIVGKNLKVLTRSKSSALVILIGPLLIIALVGFAFNTSTIHGINVGVYSDSYSDLSNQIIDSLSSEDYFVQKIDSREQCVDDVKTGESNVCLLFSENMSVENEGENKIMFYVDSTRVNLVYKLMDEIGTRLSDKNKELSLEMTGTILEQLTNTKNSVNTQIASLSIIRDDVNSLSNKALSAGSNIEDYNLTTSLSNLKYDDVEEDLSSLEEHLEDNNVSLTKFEAFNESLSEFETELSKYLVRTKSAEGALKEANEIIEDFEPGLKTTSDKLATVKSKLGLVSQGIESVEVTNKENIVTPITTEVAPIVSEGSHFNKLLPTFFVLVIMFVGIMLASILVLNEKNTNAHFRNFITPAKNIIFIFGTYLTALLIMFIQLLIIIAIGLWFMPDGSLANLGTALYPLFLIASLFIFLGICIGYLFNSSETSTLGSLFVVSASLFFSSTILPIESTPGYIQRIIDFNPFVIGEMILKKILVFGFSLGEVISSTWLLWLMIIILICISILFMKMYRFKMR